MKKDMVRIGLWFVAAAFGLFAAVWPASARAADLTAATTAELITAINTANGNSEADTITLTAGVTYTISEANNTDGDFGGNGLPKITSQITIEGNGVTIERDSSAAKFRIFFVSVGGNLTLRSLTVRGGYADGGALDQGGCILISDGGDGTLSFLTTNHLTVSNCTSGDGGGGIANRRGTVTILNSTVNDNTNLSTLRGGGIYGASKGSTTIKNSTISGNTCNGCGGGGIANISGTTVNITSATISGNTATSGAGIYTAGTLSVGSSIVSENTGGNCATDSATITSNGYNIENGTSCAFSSTGDRSSTDPLLATAGLADNGGSTKTIALQSTSPAIDAGDSATCTADTDLATDQRGAARKGTCDIGAYEFACGNSTTDPGEQCDDGNATDDDRCSNSCMGGTSCGDGVIQTNFGEECDNGASNSDTEADACRTTCKSPSCGDGVIDEGQSCDDGNATAGDGCSDVCADENAVDGSGGATTSSGGCGLLAGGNNTFNFALLGIMAFISVTAIFVSRRSLSRAR